ncbi:DUF2510 domain-containing protein [Actinoplanes sp. CA-252034]|uniref:DUF2510 domain-containing protein n=1 Tax=Actinoplanes sp. CA-252034 TaxID=3239906 RepID=UPI003D99A097
MRKFLLWVATMWVGSVSLIFGFSLFSGDGGAFLAGLLVWIVGLAFGVALSAPAFMDPPDDGAVWWFRLPLVLWLFLMVMKAISWVGFYVLLGTWTGIFHFWNSRNTGRRPTFSGGPQTTQVPRQQYAAHVPASGPAPGQVPQQRGMPPASWQHDPTGRYMSRYWDGTRWTDQVANGNVQAVDPF